MKTNKLTAKDFKKPGRKCVFSAETEAQLANLVAVVCNHGFRPIFREIQFKNGSRPGTKWMKNFMKRNQLLLKKAEMISSARKSNRSNPFIIYDYYNLLENMFQDNPDLDADRIYNCDESGFPNDQTNGKSITVKGIRALKLSFGALDPLIIFQGKNLMKSWFGTNSLPNTYYSKSDKGWMDSEAFAKWFENFCEDFKERLWLLIYDGHMTHVAMPVITLAMKENVILIKLPLHCTDRLQVLDKTCFSSLKKSWEQLLGECTNIHGVSYSLSRSEFVNSLCSIWRKGLNENNIKKG